MFNSNSPHFVFARAVACCFSVLFCLNAAQAQQITYCQYPSSDSDGDGWGWESNATCLIAGSVQDKNHEDHPACQSAGSDPDGDGYGWENGQTCLVTLADSALHPLCKLAGSDPDGDGYGWENNRTCSSGGGEGDLPACSLDLTDPDGDGYGTENGSKCIVPPGDVDLIADCESSDSDPDGDGYGWENGKSCLVVTDKKDDDLTVDDITEVIVVTGQSNVAAAETDFDAFLDQPHQRVFAYTDDGWQIADLHQVWDLHGAPGNFSTTTPDRDPLNSFAFHFGKRVAEQTRDRVPAFIVAAASGRGIAHWDYGSEFYTVLGNKVARALKDIPHKSSVDAVLWHQGENDWLYEGTADAGATGFTSKDSFEYKNYYAIKLNALIGNLRNESWGRSDTAFICGETRRAEGVNRRLMALNADADPLTGCVAATDLPKRESDPYGSHFSAEGLRTLGSRYADEYLQMTGR